MGIYLNLSECKLTFFILKVTVKSANKMLFFDSSDKPSSGTLGAKTLEIQIETLKILKIPGNAKTYTL